MRRELTAAAVLTAAAIAPLHAQSLAARVLASDGDVQVIYPTRPSACGDGRGMIGDVLDHSIYYQERDGAQRRGGWDDRLCEHGPARVVVRVVDHEIVSIHAYVGPMLTAVASGYNVSAGEAAAWLGDLALHNDSRVATDAMLPLVLADAPDPWPVLLRVARNENRPRAVRSNAMLWLGSAVNVKLGLNRAVAENDDDEVRRQAVFALAQRPKDESIPELLDIARTAKSPLARREAIFWLGQSGDRRAADLYAELLGLR